jgi:hypothetical protein
MTDSNPRNAPRFDIDRLRTFNIDGEHQLSSDYRHFLQAQEAESAHVAECKPCLRRLVGGYPEHKTKCRTHDSIMQRLYAMGDILAETPWPKDGSLTPIDIDIETDNAARD